MGCSYTALTIVGVRIDLKSLYTMKRVKAFDHNHPEDWDVDPKSGKKLWKEIAVLNEGVSLKYETDEGDENIETYIRDGECSIGDYPVVAVGRGDTGFVSMYCSSVCDYDGGGQTSPAFGGSRFVKKNDNSELSAFQNALEKADLWNEDLFGIYTVLDVSC